MEQREFLRKTMMRKTREQINEKFAGKEIHIIKAVNLLNNLDSINNLMSENVSEWKIRQPTGEAGEAFAELEKNTQSIANEKEKLIDFIDKEMTNEFPNYSVLATPIIGAKLLASAGSKKRLSFMPASTIQVLGAEKALFAHLRKNAKSPKHGHLFNHPLLQNLPRYKRGTAARIIAGKLSIALKVDYFNGENTSEKMKKEIEEKISELAAQAPTAKQEQQEKDYDSINAERRKEQFERDNKKKDYRREEQYNGQSSGRKSFGSNDKPFTPQARNGPYGNSSVRRENYSSESKPRQWQDKSLAYGPRRESSFGGPSRAPRFGPRRTEGEYGNNYGSRDSRGSSSYGPRRESFGPRRSEGFAPREEGSYAPSYRPQRSFAPRREGGFTPRTEGGYGGQRSEGYEHSEGGHGRSRSPGRYSTGGRRSGKPRKFVKKY